MKRRKFLKLIGCSPFMLLFPKVFFEKKPAFKYSTVLDSRTRFGSYTGNGTESHIITGIGFQPKYVAIL